MPSLTGVYTMQYSAKFTFGVVCKNEMQVQHALPSCIDGFVVENCEQFDSQDGTYHFTGVLTITGNDEKELLEKLKTHYSHSAFEPYFTIRMGDKTYSENDVLPPNLSFLK